MADDDIKIILNKTTGLFEPQTNKDISDFNYCPSVKVDYVELQNQIFGSKPDSIFGVEDSVFLAQSKDFQRNNKASSGGLIKRLEVITMKNTLNLMELLHLAKMMD